MKKILNYFRNKLAVYDESENKKLWQEDLSSKNLKLLMFGQSDWNFYYDVDSDRVVGIIKKGSQFKHCNNWNFGTVLEFSKFLRKGINKCKVSKSSLTKLGYVVFTHGVEKPDVLANMFSRIRYDMRESEYENTTKGVNVNG